jgi:hypothetical protein
VGALVVIDAEVGEISERCHTSKGVSSEPKRVPSQIEEAAHDAAATVPSCQHTQQEWSDPHQATTHRREGRGPWSPKYDMELPARSSTDNAVNMLKVPSLMLP